MFRITFSLLVLAVLALPVTAVDPPAAPEKLTFAFCPKMLDNPVFNYARTTAERRAKELGDVEILWQAPQEGDAAKQAQILEGLIARRVHGIAVSCNEPSALVEPINRAVGAGIPVICFDSDSPDSKRITFYGVNDYEVGRELARRLAQLMDGRGSVAMLTGVPGATNLEERMRGARDVLKEHPEIEIVTVQACEDDVAKSVSQIEAVMRGYPDLGGWLMVGGWPLFAAGSLDMIDPPGRTKVVAVDALPQQWPYLESRRVQVLIAQNYNGWGAGCVDLLRGIIDGKDYPSFSDSSYDVVTPDTLDDYKKKWVEWFGPLPEAPAAGPEEPAPAPKTGEGE